MQRALGRTGGAVTGPGRGAGGPHRRRLGASRAKLELELASSITTLLESPVVYETRANRKARDSLSISRAITRRWISFVPS